MEFRLFYPVEGFFYSTLKAIEMINYSDENNAHSKFQQPSLII